MSGQTADEVHQARLALANLDTALARAHAVAPQFEWRVKVCGLEGLARLIIEQQVSTTSAAATWKRFRDGLGIVSASNLLAQNVDALKRFGLSRQKARYVLGVAEAERAGTFDFARLSDMDDEAAIKELTRLKGIGRWTADAYLMGCEGRSDIFPAGDLALQEGLKLADGSGRRLSEKELYSRAERWRPHRGVAAHLLWSYYAAVKRREVLIPQGATSTGVASSGPKL